MICQYMNQREYDGEAKIYGHSEVLNLLKDISEKFLQPKETRFINNRLHFVKVDDGETKNIISKPVTFFDIHSDKAKQFGFCMDIGGGKKLTCCGDEPYNDTEKSTPKIANRLEVKNLLLYHTENKNIASRKRLYLAEGEKYFSGKIHVPGDLETLKI